jgi:hypothetical protein
VVNLLTLRCFSLFFSDEQNLPKLRKHVYQSNGCSTLRCWSRNAVGNPNLDEF